MAEPIREDSDNKERDVLIFELIKGRYDNEIERTNNLDSKSGNLIGFISVVVGLLLGVGTFKLPTFQSEPVFSIIYFAGIGIMLLSITFALSAFRVRRWTVVPNVQTLIANYTDLPYGKVLKRNAGEMAKGVARSEKQNNDKAKLIEFSWYFLLLGLGMVFIFIIAYIASGKGE